MPPTTQKLNLTLYKNIKQNEWELPENLETYLTGNGFKCVGSGEFSTVWKIENSNYVVKVFRSIEYSSSIDKKWYEYCYKNSNNIHLPKVGKLKSFDNWYIIFIEVLDSIPVSLNVPTMKIFSRAIKENIDPYDLNLKERFEEINNTISSNPIDDNFLDKMIDTYPTIVSIYEEIVKPVNSIQVRLDLHIGNFMLRNNDTLVVTDPIKSFLRNF